MNPFSPLLSKILLCIFSGFLVCFSFPNFLEKSLSPHTEFFAWFALIPFFLALKGIRPRYGALLGFLFGFSCLGGILYWLIFLEAADYLSFPGWAAAVFYLSLFFSLFGWLYCLFIPKFNSSAIWIAPLLWTVTEFIRGLWPWHGFSWGELGYSQAPTPALLHFTTWAGVSGLTFLIVWFNACLASWFESFLTTKSLASSRWRSIVFPALVLAGVFVWGRIAIKNTPLRSVGKVALLQPNVDQSVKWSPEYENATYDKLEKLVKQAAVFHPDLVVWPETAAPSYLLTSPRALKRVESIVRLSGTSNLVGCLHEDYTGFDKLLQFNAAVPFDSTGKSLGFYGKRHLVPFGEYVPFQEYLSFLGPVVRDLGTFSRGPKYECFRAAGFTYSPMICYEVIFPEEVRMALKTGADVLVNISNDAWYGRTASAYQHAMMVAVRAAEERKPIVRAANTGISLAVDPLGRILVSTKLFEEKVLEADVLLAPAGETFFVRRGNWLPRLCLAIIFVLAGLIFSRRRKRGGRLMASPKKRKLQKIADIAELTEGRTKKFKIKRPDRMTEAFLLMKGGKLQAYLNLCRHWTVALDFDDNDFFSEDGKWLVCKNHGAVYSPDTGKCESGPCGGASLYRVPLIEKDGAVYADLEKVYWGDA